MDFHSNLEQDCQETYAKNVFSYGEDDDVFYGELRRQVLLLTEEDSDDEELHDNRSSPNTAEARKHGSIPIPSSVKPSGCFYNWSGNKEDYAAAAPAWILNLWRTGNGTGVFIPQIVQSRRRNKPRKKKKNERGRTYKLVEKMN